MKRVLCLGIGEEQLVSGEQKKSDMMVPLYEPVGKKLLNLCFGAAFLMMRKLIPFAKECAKERSKTLVQEDNAPSHAHKTQEEIYSIFGVQRLLWPGNSPDLNMIEPAWAYLKRVTTKNGPLKTRKEAEDAWTKAWSELKQSRIQAWIERIKPHIDKVIE